jgi:hypothetical protein
LRQVNAMTDSEHARVVLVLPSDERRSLVRIRFGGQWIGDLLLVSTEERNGVLTALAAGDVEVVTRSVPVPDYTDLGGQAPHRGRRRDLTDRSRA